MDDEDSKRPTVLRTKWMAFGAPEGDARVETLLARLDGSAAAPLTLMAPKILELR